MLVAIVVSATVIANASTACVFAAASEFFGGALRFGFER